MTAESYGVYRVIPILMLAAAGLVALLSASPAEATQKLSRSTNLVCTACHDKPGSKLLTDRGKYFETQRSLEGFEEVIEEFGACTHCHSRKPGSMKLTKAGEQVRRQLEVDDMEELCRWLDRQATEAASEGDPPTAGEQDEDDATSPSGGDDAADGKAEESGV